MSPLVKYWELVADRLSKAGWSWGCVSALDSEGRTIWIVDAHRNDGKATLSAQMKNYRPSLNWKGSRTKWRYHRFLTMTLFEIRPHRWGWKAFEAPGVEPVFSTKDDALGYADPGSLR